MDAEVPSMPRNALRAVAADYVVPAADLAALLVRVSHERAAAAPEVAMDDDAKTAIEIRIAAADNALEAGVMQLGSPTPYTCPDCHGVLLAVKDGELLRFRCHTGHAFTLRSLQEAQSESTDFVLWNAMRSLEDKEVLLRAVATQHLQEGNAQEAARLQVVAHSVARHAATLRRLIEQAEPPASAGEAQAG